MTANQFQTFWDSNYGNTYPISPFLKDAYPERWLRVHSLPGSKRHPENDIEWNELLSRQNTLITDLLVGDFDIILVTGENYLSLKNNQVWSLSPVYSLDHLPFTPLKPISLGSLYPDDYDSDVVYKPIFTQVNWQPPAYNDILKDIAEDNLRVLFVSVSNQCLLAPYDGGVDIIFKDQPIKDLYKTKYKTWLSANEDGF
ncbi:DUF3885 domain-containing protein [Spirosoma lituiforme]